jgi:hypothetical protein
MSGSAHSASQPIVRSPEVCQREVWKLSIDRQLVAWNEETEVNGLQSYPDVRLVGCKPKIGRGSIGLCR